MLFVDQASITAEAGAGGRGCQSMAQPPYTRYPAPDGGNGGDGGDVTILADGNLATLLDFHFRHHFRGGRGGHGGSNQKTGRRGLPCVIRVPAGTVVWDEETGQVLRDLVRAGDEVLIAHGGRGGLGNLTVDEAQPGEAGEHRRLRLELKLVADVGFVGLPNAGKSSLLARISTARPKVAAYPFTTRYPVLGVVRAGEESAFVACDIPGLIEGASEGRGLGLQFLRHIERTRLLVPVLDLAAVDGTDPVRAYQLLMQELGAYSAALASRPQVIAGNKVDLPEGRAALARVRKALGQPVWPISCATGAGILPLTRAIQQQLGVQT
jgi:GTP-binding protein